MTTSQNDDEYYIRIRGKTFGPYTISQLRELRKRGHFGRANEISTDRENWQSAETIESQLVDAASKRTRRQAEETSSLQVLSSSPPVQPMAQSWYYSIGDDQSGPISVLELRRMISDGQLMPDDRVWKEGMSDWARIRDIAELNDSRRQAALTSPSTPSMGPSGQHNFCFACGQPTDVRAELCPNCGVRQKHLDSGDEKNRTVAMVLAFFLGGLGAHHFYLGNSVRGVLYLLFFWTFVPAILALIDFIILACMSESTFKQKYKG